MVLGRVLQFLSIGTGTIESDGVSSETEGDVSAGAFAPSMTIVAVEASIAAGKSTLLDNIDGLETDDVVVSVMPEPLEDFEDVLQLFYRDKARWAFTLQQTLFLSRLKHLREHIAKSESSAARAALLGKRLVVVIERSPFADRECFAKMLHESGAMTDLEFSIYTDRFDFEAIPRVDHVVYLRTTVDVCAGRLRTRARAAEEGGVSKEYLAELGKKHDAWLVDGAPDGHVTLVPGQPAVPVSVLDGNTGDPQHVADAFIHLLQESVV